MANLESPGTNRWMFSTFRNKESKKGGPDPQAFMIGDQTLPDSGSDVTESMTAAPQEAVLGTH